MGLVTKSDGWRLSDEVWVKMEPLLPVHKPKPHPLGAIVDACRIARP